MVVCVTYYGKFVSRKCIYSPENPHFVKSIDAHCCSEDVYNFHEKVSDINLGTGPYSKQRLYMVE